ncbi:MAG: phenylalanine--tRNA ligase subunit beta, partial [Deltaproteobacteria bacterium]|nr:phenylalanine--tRNA ligase subunit beta [Deltaproteobacteria bacterium]
MALRVPLKWLQDYVDVVLSPQELAERLTVAGLEVESVTSIGADWDRDTLVVGEVKSVAPHPDADRLCLVTVDRVQQDRQSADPSAALITVVTGAPNLVAFVKTPLPSQPLKVALALVGAEVIDGHSDDGRKIKLKPAKLRGVPSEGMVCSEYELGLSQEHEGILFLPPDAPTGTPLADYLGDSVLEFDIKGGFAHLQSIFGIAREVAALTGQSLRREVMEHAAGIQTTPAPGFVKLQIEDPALCPRYVAVLVEGIQMGPSPFWMQQRILRAGMRPINAVVDITNYVMLELGQPLHAFDLQKLRPQGGDKLPLVHIRPARQGEHLTTLDGNKRTLDTQMVVIADGGGPISIAGVMGGSESEVTDSTTSVLLESANFEFLNNRRTSQMLKLRTEASDRFGKNLDGDQCLPAAMRAAALLVQLCGGRISGEAGELHPAPVHRESIRLPHGFIHRLLGIDIPPDQVERILTDLEFGLTPGDQGWQVTPPSHRKDVTRPADLVEEVARVYGYDRMIPTLVADELPPQRRNIPLDGAERVRDILTGCGLDEIITYSIISRDDDARLHPDGSAPEEGEYVPLKNPLQADKAHLRRRLLAEGLNTMRNNLRFLNRVALFEVGTVFHPQAGEVLPRETRRVMALMTGPRVPDTWTAPRKRELFDFYDMKGVAESLLDGLEI